MFGTAQSTRRSNYVPRSIAKRSQPLLVEDDLECEPYVMPTLNVQIEIKNMLKFFTTSYN